MKQQELVQYFSQALDMLPFDGLDVSLNGLQVGPRDREVTKVAFAVDACMDSFVGAKESGAQLLFVHHGLFWGRQMAIVEQHYERIRYLVEHGISLFACHLPLDAHPVYGNNAVMAQRLGLVDIEPFDRYKGMSIGYKGILPTAMDAHQISRKLGFSAETGLKVLPFGPRNIRTVGIVSGSAADDVQQAIDEGLDAFITGESEHATFHDCSEQHITMICGGHYQTETFGVQAVQQLVGDELGLETAFVALPTGL